MLRILAFVLTMLAGAGFSSAALAAAGYIHELKGTATARVGSVGTARTIKTGDIINEGQTISTGPNSSAVIKFEDGQIIALHADSAFTVQTYKFDKQDVKKSSAAFDFLRGGLRFITGLIGANNRNALKLTTGTMTIGVRGTDVQVYRNALTNAIIAAVTQGAVSLFTGTGVAAQLTAGNFTTSADGTTVATAQALSNLGTVVQNNAAVQALQQMQVATVPLNSMVNLQASANAAAAVALAAANPNNPDLQAAAQQAVDAAVQAAQNALTAVLNAPGNSNLSLPQPPPGVDTGTPPPPASTIQQNVQEQISPN